MNPPTRPLCFNTLPNPVKELLPVDVIARNHTFLCSELIGERDQLFKFVRPKEPVSGVATKLCQRRFVEICGFKLPLFQKHRANRAQKTDLITSVIMFRDMLFKRTLYDGAVVGQSVESEDVFQETEKAVDLYTVGFVKILR